MNPRCRSCHRPLFDAIHRDALRTDDQHGARRMAEESRASMTSRFFDPWKSMASGDITEAVTTTFAPRRGSTGETRSGYQFTGAAVRSRRHVPPAS
jgi:hypothetical protein